MRFSSMLILLPLLYAGIASAMTCSDLFGNAAGARDRLQVEDRAKLLNTGDRILQTDDLRLWRSDSCDSARCLESGSPAASVSFTRSTAGADLTRSRSFDPGDYYYDDVRLGEDDVITVSGSGQVRIHVRDDFTAEEDARINVGGNAANLVFIVYDNIQLVDNVQIAATLYAGDNVKLSDDVEMQGALVGDRVELEDNTELTFSPLAGNSIEGLCAASTGGGGPGPSPSPEHLTFRIEVGALTVINTYDKPEFTRVNFTQIFDDPPVVFTLPTTDGGNTAAHRVRNVTVDGFDIMTLEPDGEDGPHIAMSLNYLAVEKGTHTLPGGGKLSVGTLITRTVQGYGLSGGWDTVSFGSDFSVTPAVLGQIQSMANEQEILIPSRPSKPWLTTAISDVTASSMKIALERSESLSGAITTDEEIGYLAVEPFGRLTFLDSGDNAIDMEVIRSNPVVQGWSTCNRSANRVYFSRRWDSTPIVLATKNTRDGDSAVGEGDGGWFRRCRTTNDYVALAVDEVRKNNIGDRNRVHNASERAGIVVISDNFVTEARQLHHYRLEHDGNGLSGVAEDVTIRVCKNSDCSELYTGPVTVTLTPGNSVTRWSGTGVMANQVTFTGGSKTVQVTHNASGTIILGASATPVAANPVRCYIGATQDCRMTFPETNFTVSVPDQVSGDAAVGSVSLSTCIDVLKSKRVNLSAVATYLDPSSSGPALSVNGASLPTDGSAGTVSADFDSECRAPLNVRYQEAGSVDLALTYSEDGLIITGSDSAVFYPAALVVEAVNASGTVLNATGSSALPVQGAGRDFELAITAVNRSGLTTKRYQPQGSDRLRGYLRRKGPLDTGSVDGVLKVGSVVSLGSSVAAAGSLADFSDLGVSPGSVLNGSYRYDAAFYDEVGLVALDVADSDYFGHQIDAVETPIGRFVPASFGATATLANRSAAACAGASFSYLDESLTASIDLSALNAGGAVTRNYLGSFAKFDGTGFARYAGTPGDTLSLQHAGNDLSGRLQIDSSGVSTWVSGTARMDVEFAMQRGATVDGPFDGSLIGFSIIDDDGVELGSLDLDMNSNGSDDHLLLGTTNLRYGRLVVGNAHGSQLRDLPVPVTAQYFAGPAVGFVTHTGDDCSPLTSANLADADPGDELAVGETCIWDTPGLSGAFACTAPATPAQQYLALPLNGAYRLILAASGGNNVGSLNVMLDAPDYLHFDWSGTGGEDPQATATFGIFRRDNNVIYQRELR